MVREKTKVSIITVVYNNANNIRSAVESVLSQDFSNIEYVVIDGGSTDGTLGILEDYQSRISKLISEPDEGIYDALNKGISHCSGDIIAILHSDDVFFNKSVVSKCVAEMLRNGSEICFSDIVICDKRTEKVSRYYMAWHFRRWMLRLGWMPPHPSCFIRKSLFSEFGVYSKNFKIAGDFDFLVRIFYGKKVRWSYINMVSVCMSEGGASNSGWTSKFLIAKEINAVLKSHKIWSLPLLQVFRYVLRLFEFVKAYGTKLDSYR